MFSSAQNCKVYVGNLPDCIRPRDIEDIFWKFGRIRNVDLHDRSRGPPFAFVEFEDERGAEDAVHYRNGYDFDGYRLRVEIPRTPKYLSRPSRDRDPYDRLGDSWGNPPRSSRAPPPPRRRRRSNSRRGEFRVLVSDLPRSASWQDLKDHFREAGEIIYTDASSDGTGVLDFASRKAMDYAVKYFDDKKFRSHQGESTYIRVRPSRKSKKSHSRSRSRTRSRERRSRSRSKGRYTLSRERENNRSRDKSESKYRRNRSSRSGSRKGRDSRDYSRGNSAESRDMEESPRRKKMRKELKRGRSGSASSEEEEKIRRKSRRDRSRLDSRGSRDESSRENSEERSPSKSSERSHKDSMSPIRKSDIPRDESEERTPEPSPEPRVRSKSDSRGSTPQESSESRKSSGSSSPSGTPIQNSSSPEPNQGGKEEADSPEGLHENGEHLDKLGDATAGNAKEDTFSDEHEPMDA